MSTASNWKRFVCYAIGCRWQPADDGSHGIAGTFNCARCGEHWPAVDWAKPTRPAPPMPECKPARIDDDLERLRNQAAGELPATLALILAEMRIQTRLMQANVDMVRADSDRYAASLSAYGAAATKVRSKPVIPQPSP